MKPNQSRTSRILVIDDERFIAELMRDVLTRHGYAVDMRHDGPLALEAATRSRYDLIISDFAMPGLNGLDLIRRLRVASPTTRVVIVSAYLDTETVDALEGEPMFASFLKKPFDIFELTRLADAITNGVAVADGARVASPRESSKTRIGLPFQGGFGGAVAH